MVSLLAAILVFGLIILFHEFGHFLLAKRGGICVVEFSLGMGPRLVSFVKGGTRYSIKLFPFGGSCMMLGEDEDLSEEDSDEKAERDIAQKAAFLTDERETATGEPPMAQGEEAAQMPEGLQLPPGASGVSFNETSVWTRFLVIAAGPVFNFILAFFCACFVIGYAGYDPPEIYQVLDGYPAQEAGLMKGDVITNINGKNIKVYRDILSYTMFHPGKAMTIKFRRDGETRQVVLEPKYSEENKGYMIGLSGGGSYKTKNILQTAEYGLYEVRYWIDLTFKSLGMIFKGKVGADDVAGPVRIVTMIGDTVKESSEFGLMVVLINLANMCVLLSANLGIMNLLPIPALDGGRLVFIVLEALRGKPIDREKEGMIHMAGMAVLMVLMVFILFNDIKNLL